jgi:hypothetical protein
MLRSKINIISYRKILDYGKLINNTDTTTDSTKICNNILLDIHVIECLV